MKIGELIDVLSVFSRDIDLIFDYWPRDGDKRFTLKMSGIGRCSYNNDKEVWIFLGDKVAPWDWGFGDKMLAHVKNEERKK